MLTMTDICKDYPMGKSVTHVLKNVNLSVNEGDYIAIMGPSGSGKTTLMNIIGCLDVPTTGNYLFGEKDIKKLRKKQLADLRNRKIGFVFQSFNLLPKLTALDNVALPLLYGGVRRSERRRRAKEALERVGLSDRLNYRPDQLSGGQSQRVAIARAIVANPALILADEPTGALDSQSGAQVMELFHTLHEQGATILMITHDRNVAENAETIMHIKDGVLTGGDADE
ncbi:MAG: ABC transporter ATP-binding protein [Lachnospiraceae bacterium]|nr:ABC transporter ATP-binding protein [Lachnospiraceae bacterium]